MDFLDTSLYVYDCLASQGKRSLVGKGGQYKVWTLGVLECTFIGLFQYIKDCVFYLDSSCSVNRRFGAN